MALVHGHVVNLSKLSEGQGNQNKNTVGFFSFLFFFFFTFERMFPMYSSFPQIVLFLLVFLLLSLLITNSHTKGEKTVYHLCSLYS